MFGLHFKSAESLQNSPCNNSRNFINLRNEEVDGSWMVQKGEGSRERLVSYSLESQGYVTPGFWKPRLVTQLSVPPAGGSVRGRGEWGCCWWLLPGEAESARLWFWSGEDYFSFHVFTPLSCVAKESRPQHCIIACFECILFWLWSIGKYLPWWVICLFAYFCTCCYSLLKALVQGPPWEGASTWVRRLPCEHFLVQSYVYPSLVLGW